MTVQSNNVGKITHLFFQEVVNMCRFFKTHIQHKRETQTHSCVKNNILTGDVKISIYIDKDPDES